MKASSAGFRATAVLGAGALALGLAAALPATASAVTYPDTLPAGDVGSAGAVQSSSTSLGRSLPGMTASKTQSKTWYAEGSWWAAMKRTSGDGLGIFKLVNRDSGAAPTWSDTGVVIDSRSGVSDRAGTIDDTLGMSADTLYVGSTGYLFIASHVVSATNANNTTEEALLTRFSFVGGTWVRDYQVPMQVDQAVPALSITQASDGRIVAAFARDSRPWIATTSTSANNSTTSFTSFRLRWSGTANKLEVPNDAEATTITRDDVMDITSSGSYVTVVFSNQETAFGMQGFYVARHRTGDRWGTGNFYGSRITNAPFSADNHISLLPTPGGGSTSAIYAAVKTSYDDADNGARTVDPGDPLLRVFKIQPRPGFTVKTTQNSGYVDLAASSTVSTVAQHGTRPVMTWDTSRNRMDVFFAAPSSLSSTNVSGVVWRQSLVPSTLALSGDAVPVLFDKGSEGNVTNRPDGLNDPTVTQGFVNATTGTVVLGTGTVVTPQPAGPITNVTKRYWWNDVSVPVAGFDFAPVDGDTTARQVDFTSTSTRRPTSYLWEFGAGASQLTSTSANPGTITYDSPGTKTVKLTVSNDWGTTSTTQTLSVGVAPTAGFTTGRIGARILGAVITDRSTGLVDTISYDFGDKTSAVNLAPGTVVRHRYAKAGAYYVKQTATNAKGSNTKTLRVVITATPAKPKAPAVSSRAGRKVLVKWTAPVANGRAIQKYQIICRPKAGAGVRSRLVGYKYRSAYVTKLVRGKTYSCTVRAYNAVGWSLLSNRSVYFKARA